MHCDEARLLITARVDGELDGERTDALDAHLNDCADCVAALALRERERDTWREALEAEAPDALRGELLAGATVVRFPRKHRRRASRWQLWAAAAVLAVVIGGRFAAHYDFSGGTDGFDRPGAVHRVRDGVVEPAGVYVETTGLDLGDTRL
jgi:anti-sigma factor RsiW